MRSMPRGKYEVLKQFAADRWVFGDNAFDLKNAPKLSTQLMQVYEQDYIRFLGRRSRGRAAGDRAASTAN